MSLTKLILTAEVTGLGSSGDTVEVKGGYARNYLLPRGLAIQATRGAEKQIESLRRARAARDVRSLDEAQTVAAQLAKLTVTLPAKAGDGGRLFGRITTADVVAAVTAAATAAVVTRPKSRPPAPARAGTRTVSPSSRPARALASSRLATSRAARARRSDSTCFSAPRVAWMASPRGRR